jgi:hypothetical protein
MCELIFMVNTESSQHPINRTRKTENTFIAHKFTDEDYNKKVNELQVILSSIEADLAQFVTSSLKMKMLQINIENISGAIKYYFNSRTSRPLSQMETNFRQSAAQIIQATRFLPGSEKAEKTKQRVCIKLDNLLKSIGEQNDYIKELEEERHKTMKERSFDQLLW